MRHFISLLALAFASSAAFAEIATDNPQTSALDKAVHTAATEFFKDTCHVGMSMVVSDQGRVAFYNYGTTSKTKPGLPTPDSLYEIGSVTKTFTGAIAAKAILDKKMTLDGDFRTHLKEAYPNLEKNGKPITLRTLTTHTSGMPRDIPANDDLFKNPDFEKLPYQLLAREKDYDRARYLKELHDVTLNDEPGKTMAYSNIGIKLISFGLENANGRSFAELLKTQITVPLNMPSTALEVAPKDMPRRVQGYGQGGKEAPYHLLNVGAAGGLYSSSRDMVRYLNWHLTESDPAIKQTHMAMDGSLPGYAEGMGWNMTITPEGTRKIWQSGGMFGMSSQMIIFPDQKTGFVLLANDGCFNTQSQLETVALSIHATLKPAK